MCGQAWEEAEDDEKMEDGRNGVKHKKGWRWMWKVLKMSRVRMEGARDAGGLEWVGLGEKIKAQVLRWTDWKSMGSGKAEESAAAWISNK